VSETRVLDTNVSAKAWRARVQHRSVIFGAPQSGEVYVCPRCEWESRPMRWRDGAIRLGMEHALACFAAPSVPG
jgi:hypothetical protein